MTTADISNNTLSDATDEVMKILAKVARLKDGHLDHLKFTVEIGQIMVGFPLLAKCDILIPNSPQHSKSTVCWQH